MYPCKEVVLLNPDTLVANDWLDRLLSHVRTREGVATVTPFSNNATIVSYPLLNENNAIEMEADAQQLDRLAAECNLGRASEIPVGIGFCLLVSIKAREVLGGFDEASFGRGYGEESDFCLRATKAGLSNLLAEDVFVYHVGKVSFGIAYRGEELGDKTVSLMHPDFRERVRQHLGADSTEFGRIRLDLKRIAVAAGSSATVIITHARSGGISTYVDLKVQKLRKTGETPILVRVGVGNRWNVEVSILSENPPFTPNLRAFSIRQFREHLSDFLDWVAPKVIDIQSFVGLDWSAVIDLITLVRGSGRPYRFTVHDYSILCHRNDLVDSFGRYCGLARVERCRLCVSADRFYPEAVDPLTLRRTYEDFLRGAQQVSAPSNDVASRLETIGVPYPIKVVRHDEEYFRPTTSAVRVLPDDIVIATIGAIGLSKGSRVLLSLARDTRIKSKPIKYHIIGYSDVSEDLQNAGITETGPFEGAHKALDIAASLRPDILFLPFIWPETWSYTLSMAFALGIPPVVFDIGAPAERIREKGFGVVVPYRMIENISALNDLLIELGRAYRVKSANNQYKPRPF